MQLCMNSLFGIKFQPSHAEQTLLVSLTCVYAYLGACAFRGSTVQFFGKKLVEEYIVV